ncbi:MAG: pentapeptide repeat-containing protein, partial [Gammaproteobacteria bacterium]|nr:pentapeptide repeat-containing protein [Gammaproteobacteria bacterium]
DRGCCGSAVRASMKFNKQAPDTGMRWFVRRGVRVKGPFDSASLRRLVQAKRVLLSDEVSLDQRQWHQVALMNEVLPPEMRASAADQPAQPAPAGSEPFPLLPLLISLALVVGVIGLFLWFDQGRPSDRPDCAAAAAAGVNWNHCRHPGVQAEQLDLGGLSASNADLSGGRFSGANLQQANLQYANLTRADLSYADLSQASLKGAILRQADLSNADLSGANLSYADLTQANLANARLDDAIWSSGKRCAAGSIGTCVEMPAP